jgi:hypothetical protein
MTDSENCEKNSNHWSFLVVFAFAGYLFDYSAMINGKVVQNIKT